MTTLSVACKRCLAEVELTRSDIMRGIKWWSLCPCCREADAAELPSNLTKPDTPAQMAGVTEGDGSEEIERGAA